jgi:hypothetical protein
MKVTGPIPPEKILKEKLKPEERKMLEDLAAWVVRRGMTVPAILFLESTKPLSFVGSQVVVFLSPALEILFDPVRIATFVSLMEDRKNVELLLREIEERDNESQKNLKALKARMKEEKRKKREERRRLKLERKPAGRSDAQP